MMKSILLAIPRASAVIAVGAILLACCTSSILFAQQGNPPKTKTGQVAGEMTKSRILSGSEIEALKESGLATKYPVFRAYEYADAGGVFIVALNEKPSGIDGDDTVNSHIQAVCYARNSGGLLEKWNIQDAFKKNERESSIWFWTKYCSFTDLDNDNVVDPVIVYGTKGEYSIGSSGNKRLVIIVMYKGKKYAIRAIEDEADFARKLKKDKAILALPIEIRKYLDALLEKLRLEQHLILSDG